MGAASSTESLHKGKHGYYGWKPDKPDPRDIKYHIPFTLLARAQRVKKLDLRPGCPKVYDQKDIGSCTANAVGGAFEFDLKKQGLPDFMPSRLFIYWNERVLENSTDTDSGATIRDGIKSLNKEGVCRESTWPYDTTKFAEKPPQQCFLSAKGNTLTKYARVSQTVEDLKAALVHERVPIPFGFMVHESFDNPENTVYGKMPMPGSAEEDPVVGGHAVALVGFDDDREVFIVRNSWGNSWGENGYFYMPYKFVEDPNECRDFWVLRYVEETSADTAAGKKQTSEKIEKKNEKPPKNGEQNEESSQEKETPTENSIAGTENDQDLVELAAEFDSLL